MIISRVHNGEVQELEVSYRVDKDGRCICVCPPIPLQGCYDLRNRGFNLDYEVTVWPRRLTEFGCLTTGGHDKRTLKKSCGEIYALASMARTESQYQQLVEQYDRATKEQKQRVQALPVPQMTERGDYKRSAAYKLAEAILSGKPQQ